MKVSVPHGFALSLYHVLTDPAPKWSSKTKIASSLHVSDSENSGPSSVETQNRSNRPGQAHRAEKPA